MKVYTLKKKYSELEIMEKIDPPIIPLVEENEVISPPTMSIYDAWRSGHITQEAYQKWIKDGYPKTLRIEI